MGVLQVVADPVGAKRIAGKTIVDGILDPLPALHLLRRHKALGLGVLNAVEVVHSVMPEASQFALFRLDHCISPVFKIHASIPLCQILDYRLLS